MGKALQLTGLRNATRPFLLRTAQRWDVHLFYEQLKSVDLQSERTKPLTRDLATGPMSRSCNWSTNVPWSRAWGMAEGGWVPGRGNGGLEDKRGWSGEKNGQKENEHQKLGQQKLPSWYQARVGPAGRRTVYRRHYLCQVGTRTMPQSTGNRIAVYKHSFHSNSCLIFKWMLSLVLKGKRISNMR